MLPNFDAPAKSLNFASTGKATAWLRDTVWKNIGSKIGVATDFRYLGAHITTRQTPTSSTLDSRWDRAIAQCRRLRNCPASTKAKVNILLAKTYASAMYGIEVARVTPSQIAKFTVAVVDVFRSRNNNHNVD